MVVLGLLCLGLLALLAYLQREWRQERFELIQRLQAPDQAAAEYMVRQGKREKIPVLPYDDDGAYRALKERRGMNGGD